MPNIKDGVIQIGFETDVKEFVKEIKKELSSVKDWGLSDSLKDEIDDINKMLDGLSKSFSDGMNTKLDTKTFAGFEKKITAEMQTIDKRVTNLEDSMQALVTTMDSADSGKLTSFLQTVGSQMTDLKQVTDATVGAVGELVNLSANSGGAIKLADNSSIESLEKEKKSLQDILALIEQIDADENVGDVDLSKNYKKASSTIKSFYSSLISIQEEYNNALAKGADDQELTRLQEKYTKAYSNLDGLRNQFSTLFPEKENEEYVKSISKSLFDARDVIDEFANRATNRFADVSRALNSLGQKSAISMNKEKSSLTVPMDISTTGKGLASKALRIIEAAQKAIKDNPLQVDFALQSKYSSRKTNDLLKEWQESIGEIDSPELREKFENLYNVIAKDFQKEIKIKVSSNVYDEEVKVKRVIENIKKLVGNKIHIFPEFDIKDVDVEKLQKKVDKIARQLKLNVDLLPKGAEEKTNEQLEALKALSDTLATKLDNLNKNYLSDIKKSLADILSLAQTLKNSAVQTDAPIDELVSSVKELATSLQKALGVFTNDDLDGIFVKMQNSVAGISGSLRGGEKNNLVVQLKEILALYKQYKDLGGAKELSDLGGQANVQKWLANHANDEVTPADPFVVEGKNNANGYAEGIRSGIPTVRAAAKEMAEAALEEIRKTQNSNSPAKETEELGQDANLGYEKGLQENLEQIKKAVSEKQKEVNKVLEAQKPLDDLTQKMLSDNAKALGLDKTVEVIKDATTETNKFADSMQEVVDSVKEISTEANSLTEFYRGVNHKGADTSFWGVGYNSPKGTTYFSSSKALATDFYGGEFGSVYKALLDLSDNILKVDALERNFNELEYFGEATSELKGLVSDLRALKKSKAINTRDIQQAFFAKNDSQEYFDSLIGSSIDSWTNNQEAFKNNKTIAKRYASIIAFAKEFGKDISSIDKSAFLKYGIDIDEYNVIPENLRKAVDICEKIISINQDVNRLEGYTIQDIDGFPGSNLTTNLLSEKAKNKGYNGVLFKDIIDGDVETISDVVAVFNKEIVKSSEQLSDVTVSYNRARDAISELIGITDDMPKSADNAAQSIANIIANAEKLEKVDSPLTKKNFNSLKRAANNSDRPDQQTAQNIIDYTKLYMESGQSEILKVIRDYVDSSNLKDTLKGALHRTFTSAIEAAEKATVAETQAKPQTERVTMTKKQYADYMHKYAPWKGSDEFSYNLNRSIEELQKRGMASRKTTKSGKLGAWEIQVDVPINQLDKLEQKEKEVVEQSEKTSKAVTDLGDKAPSGLQKHIDKYEELKKRQQDYLSQMSAMATSRTGKIENPDEYAKLKHELDSTSRQMQKEVERIHNLSQAHVEAAQAADKQSQAEKQASSDNITQNLQKKIDKYRELNQELQELLSSMSKMATTDSGHIEDSKAYSQLKNRAQGVSNQIDSLVSRAYANNKADLKALAEGHLEVAAAAKKQADAEKDTAVSSASSEVANEVQKATEAIENEGKSAQKGTKKKERLAKAEKKLAEGSKEAASETDKAAEAIEKEYKNADKNREKVLREEQKIRKAIAEAPRKEAESMLSQMDGAKWQKNFTSSFSAEIDNLRKQIEKLLSSDNIDMSALDAIKSNFNSLDETVSNTRLAAEQTLAEETSITGMQAKIAGFMDQNTAMSREFKKQLKDLLNTLENGGEITVGELKRIGSEFNRVTAQVKELHQTGQSFGSSFLKQLKSANAQLIATYFSFQDFIRYAREGFQTIVEVDTALTELRKVSDASDDRLAQSFKISTETAKELGSTISDVIGVTADWARLGYNVDEAEELARVTTLFKTVGDNMSAEDTSSYMVSTLQGFQMQTEQAIEIADKFNEVANNFAIDTAGIGEALQRSAASFNAANTDLSEAIALVTATNTVVQNPESVGTLWKTMSARIRGAKTELQELDEEEDEFTETTSKLQGLVKGLTGFDILEEDGKTFKSIYDIILGIGKEWKNLTDIEQASLGEALAGRLLPVHIAICA